MIAKLGYVAFCADVYGKGIRPTDPKECAALSSSYKKDLPLLRRRVSLALEQLRKQKLVDKAKVAAVGYCFGGTSVLELARSRELSRRLGYVNARSSRRGEGARACLPRC